MVKGGSVPYNTLQELLFEIPGFTERGISAELISPPPHGGTPSERPRPAAAAVGRPCSTPVESSATETTAESGTSKLKSSSQIRRYVLSL